MRLCLLRNPCVRAEYKFLGVIRLMMNCFKFLKLFCELNFGLLDKLWTAASATSAATYCAHALCILIDEAERYNCCPAQQQTRQIESLWISTAQTGLTHQQNGNLSGPRGVEWGIHQLKV